MRWTSLLPQTRDPAPTVLDNRSLPVLQPPEPGTECLLHGAIDVAAGRDGGTATAGQSVPPDRGTERQGARPQPGDLGVVDRQGRRHHGRVEGASRVDSARQVSGIEPCPMSRHSASDR